MTVLRGIAALAGLGILAAVAHVTIMATGGYADTNAPITIALAVGVAIGAPVAGVGSRGLAVFLIAALIAGELYGFLATANWHVAHLEAQAAPVHELEARRKAAQGWVTRLEHDDRVERAEQAAKAARADANTSSRDKGCGPSCRATLAKTVDAAEAAVTEAQSSLQLEQRQARAELEHSPLPPSPSPLADRLGLPAWELDLIGAGLRSFACTVLAGALLAFAAHGRQRRHELAPNPSSSPSIVRPVSSIAGVAMVEDARPLATATDVARFMLACLPRARGSEAEMHTAYARFCRWCDEQELRPLDKPGFAVAIKEWCERGKISVRRDGGKVYCVDVKLAS